MPVRLLPLTDVSNSVIRPIVTDIVEDLFKITQIDPNTTIYFPGDTEQVKQTDSALAHDGEKNQFGYDGYVYVEVDYRPIEDLILTNTTIKPSTNFTFFDEALGIYARPARNFSEIDINIRYRAKTKADGERWADDIKNKLAQGRVNFLHRPVTYSYDIPPTAMAIFKELHRLRENKFGYGEDFNTWFKARSSKYVTVITNQAGSEAADQYTIGENLARVQGGFDNNSATLKGQYVEGTSSAWEFTFTYRAQCDIVEGYTLIYPIIVHNQLLSERYVNYTNEYDALNFQYGFDLNLYQGHIFENEWRMRTATSMQMVNIPHHDDFIGQEAPATATLFNALIRLNEPNEGDVKELLDFSQLGVMKLDTEILSFLKSEYRWLLKIYDSVFNLAYFRGDKNIWNGDTPIRVSPEGKVYSTYEFDYRLVHHLKLSVVTDLSFLSQDALDRLRQNICVFKRIISVIWPSFDLSQIPTSRPSVQCGPVSKDWFEDFIDIYNGVNKDQIRKMKTVGLYAIEGLLSNEK